VYEDLRGRLGETAAETVKAITMLSTVSNKLYGPSAAIEWSKLELQIREEVQGVMHPRTQQARRNHANLLEAISSCNQSTKHGSGIKAGSASVACGGSSSDPKKAGESCQSARSEDSDVGRKRAFTASPEEEVKESDAGFTRKGDSKGGDGEEPRKQAKIEKEQASSTDIAPQGGTRNTDVELAAKREDSEDEKEEPPDSESQKDDSEAGGKREERRDELQEATDKEEPAGGKKEESEAPKDDSRLD
jgi:hypothetical protein